MAVIRSSAPYFPVADVAAAAQEYENAFGFTIDYIAGEPAEFAIVSRDGCSVMLRRVPQPELIRPNEGQGGAWDVFFWVDDADGLFSELQDRGARVAYPPADQAAYHIREFAIRDTSGYVLGFGQPLH
ncbi:MAG: VOC family protein [Gemmatimonadetes bacterium]|nr:VOC family protein [Gemmatimonadota bacterium]